MPVLTHPTDQYPYSTQHISLAEFDGCLTAARGIQKIEITRIAVYRDKQTIEEDLKCPFIARMPIVLRKLTFILWPSVQL